MAADDRTLITTGRAAEMLRVTPEGVRWYIRTGLLAGIVAEGPHRSRQLMVLKGEARRLNAARAEWVGRRRRARAHEGQWLLPLVVERVAPRTPVRWTLARFRPRMAKARLCDRQVKPIGCGRKTG
jgi:hypothetical protein